ncbi:MAG: DUF975 family protein [Clostridia bacterium]|nr:DUF975 family protein [Clostridia bacterium]
MLSTSQIKKEARERFAVNRFQAMLAYSVVYMVVIGIAMTATLLAITVSQFNIVISAVLWWYGAFVLLVFFVLLAPFQYSMAGFYLKSYRAQKADVSAMLDGFSRYNLERGIILHLLRTLLALAFTILLIVPGIIFLVRTSMSVYLLRANPNLKPMQALKASNKIMKGHSGAYFVLNLSFIGWFLFGLLSLFIGFIWVVPYVNTSKVVFYKRNIQGDTSVYGQKEITVPHGDVAQPVAAPMPEPEPIAFAAPEPTEEPATFDDVAVVAPEPVLQAETFEPIIEPIIEPVPQTEEQEIGVTALDNFKNSMRTDDRSFDEQALDINDLIDGKEPAFVTEQPPELNEEEARAARREAERRERLERIKLERERFTPAERPKPMPQAQPQPRPTPAQPERPAVQPVEKPATPPPPKKPVFDDFDDLFGPDKLDIEIEE